MRNRISLVNIAIGVAFGLGVLIIFAYAFIVISLYGGIL